MWGPEFRAEIINMLQMKFYICCEKLSNLVRIQKSAFKIQIARTPDLISRGDDRKTIKAIKVLRVKCASFTGTFKGVAMAYNNRCLLFRYGEHR